MPHEVLQKEKCLVLGLIGTKMLNALWAYAISATGLKDLQSAGLKFIFTMHSIHCSQFVMQSSLMFFFFLRFQRFGECLCGVVVSNGSLSLDSLLVYTDIKTNHCS
jgi:hypothetical protein